MKPRELVDTARAPEGAELCLVRHDQDYVIMIASNELMNSRLGGSEEALARMTCERLGSRARAHLLIGGYGMGFTLRAALGALGPDARVRVAEITPKIIDWARGPMAKLTAGCLDDPRVELALCDVRSEIDGAKSAYDAILLDVDNGPSGLTCPSNDELYAPGGLARARAALKPGGVLAVWSARPDPAFARRLHQAGFRVEERSVRARSNGKGPRHVIWLAQRSPQTA